MADPFADSRGGQLARAPADRRPDQAVCVITLRAGLNDPFAISIPLTAAVVAAQTVPAPWHGWLPNERMPLRLWYQLLHSTTGGVRLTSIFARHDGVVRPEACVIAGATNVEVNTTDLGLAAHPGTYQAVATALGVRLKR